MRTPLLWIIAICTHAIAHAQSLPIIELDTNAGDAWTFTLPVSGRFDREHCDSVAVETPIARIEALRLESRFVAQLPLLTGANELRAVCRRAGRIRAETPPQQWRVPLADLPKAWIRVRTDAQHIELDAGRSTHALGLAAPLQRFAWRARSGNPAALQTRAGEPLDTQSKVTGEQLALLAPTRDGEYYVTLRITDALGRSDESTAVFIVEDGAPRTVDLDSEHPSWVDSAVLYGAAPYMFEPQGFGGIEQRLGQIAALGATVLWLSPVTAAPDDDFGYAVTDQFAIRRSFGGATALRSLIERAHALGLRVLVDFVPNHFSQMHAYFMDAQRNGPRSPYRDWFERDARGEPTQYFDWAHLKNLNFDHPGVRNHIAAAAARMVREFEVDGFRIDASWAVAQRAPEFWPALRRELKRIDPDIVLLAEASAREPYHVQNGFDVAYDWTEQLGQWAWHDAFREDGTIDPMRLRAALTNEGRGYPPDSLILRFINNNDTGKRFIERFGPKTAGVAATLLFTLPGIPLIYNGDEVGAEFLPYDEGPPIQWRNTPLTEHYRRLARLRSELPQLRSREMRLVHTNHERKTLTFVRPGDDNADDDNADILVVLNFSDQALSVRPREARDRALLARVDPNDLLSGEPIPISIRDPSVHVPAHSAAVVLTSTER